MRITLFRDFAERLPNGLLLFLVALVCISVFGAALVSVVRTKLATRWITSVCRIQNASERHFLGIWRLRELSYRYVVDGVVHFGSRLSFGNPFETFDDIYDQIASAAGRDIDVPVYYDPQNPSRAVLVRHLSVRGLLAMGLFLVLLAVLVIVVILTGSQSQP